MSGSILTRPRELLSFVLAPAQTLPFESINNLWIGLVGMPSLGVRLFISIPLKMEIPVQQANQILLLSSIRISLTQLLNSPSR